MGLFKTSEATDNQTIHYKVDSICDDRLTSRKKQEDEILKCIKDFCCNQIDLSLLAPQDKKFWYNLVCFSESELVDEIVKCNPHQMKATKHYFAVMLFNMLYRVFLSFEFVEMKS